MILNKIIPRQTYFTVTDNIWTVKEHTEIIPFACSPTPRFVQKLTVFYEMAKSLSKLSHDKHTQCGTIIVDREWRLLGGGYNGFPKGFPDSELPVEREEETSGKYEGICKYDLFNALHSEVNAIYNCTHKPTGGIVITTGRCCSKCLIALHQNDIAEVYQYQFTANMVNTDKEKKVRDLVILNTNMKVFEFTL